MFGNFLEEKCMDPTRLILYGYKKQKISTSHSPPLKGNAGVASESNRYAV